MAWFFSWSPRWPSTGVTLCWQWVLNSWSDVINLAADARHKELRRGWLRGVDLNHRPLGYEPNELPGCSTPQIKTNRAFNAGQMSCARVEARLSHSSSVPERALTRLPRAVVAFTTRKP